MEIEFCNVDNVWKLFKGDGSEEILCKAFGEVVEKYLSIYIGFARKEQVLG